jgi:hypothetical protein
MGGVAAGSEGGGGAGIGSDAIATFILIHDAWHGGWCWERVTPLLDPGALKLPLHHALRAMKQVRLPPAISAPCGARGDLFIPLPPGEEFEGQTIVLFPEPLPEGEGDRRRRRWWRGNLHGRRSPSV